MKPGRNGNEVLTSVPGGWRASSPGHVRGLWEAEWVCGSLSGDDFRAGIFGEVDLNSGGSADHVRPEMLACEHTELQAERCRETRRLLFSLASGGNEKQRW